MRVRAFIQYIVASLMWLILASGAASAPYDEWLTPKAKQAYSEDINVWVYTSEFAERFGMPERWIDDDLRGAYAVAYRIETLPVRLMLPHKGPNVSIPQRMCVLDLYVSATAPIPWIAGSRTGFKYYPPRSAHYLAPQEKTDMRWRWRAIGLPYWGGVVRAGVGDSERGGMPVREFDREVFPGISYVSFLETCGVPTGKSTWLKFRDYVPRRLGSGLQEIEPGEVVHEVHIPGSFWDRVYKRWHERLRDPFAG